MRPDVVWFGESIPTEALEMSLRAAEHCDVFMIIGTSAVVQPAASLHLTALRNHAHVIEINLERTPISGQVTWSFTGKAGELLSALYEQTYDEDNR